MGDCVTRCFPPAAGEEMACENGTVYRDSSDIELPLDLQVGLYPILTSQCSSTTLYRVSYHIQHLLF